MPMLSKTLSKKARQKVSSRNVFRPNGKTRRAFTGRVVGHYRRLGTNAWDDYEFIAEEMGETSVFPTVKIQLEAEGSRFRMRKRGMVKVLEWVPTTEELKATDDDPAARRAAFLQSCVTSAANKAGIGAGAFIVRKLNT